MSVNFSAIKGYHNKVNLGDTGYNSSESFDKNQVYTGGNPSNWNGNFNIQKEPSKSVHTRYIEKIDREVISNMNRNQEVFDDRMNDHINHYPTGRNIMATGIDYGGNPYKIGDSSKTCKFNIGDYVNPTQNYALSRKPVQHVQTNTNKIDTFLHTSNVQKNPNLKSINSNYLNANVNVNKKERYAYNTNNMSQQNINKHINNNKIHYNVSGNATKNNNYNNLQNRHVDSKILNENYQYVQASTNIQSNLTKDPNRNFINTNNYMTENYTAPNVHTNLKKNYNELDRQQRSVKLENKLRLNEGYSNNRQGLPKQTENLKFRL